MEYEVTTEQFSGPLDLLLHLIREHNMDLMSCFRVFSDGCLAD